MSNLIQHLNALEKHSLDWERCAPLLNRRDRKFLIDNQTAQRVIGSLHNHYSVLEIGDSCLHRYRTLYLDTRTWHHYYAHHHNKPMRKKFRLRHYESTGNLFFEIKTKLQNRITSKQRLELDPTADNAQDWLPDELHPVLWVSYKRITLLSKNRQERITLDFEIEHQSALDPQRHTHLNGAVILEHKSLPETHNCIALELLRRQGLHELKISKYCTGIAMLHGDQVKYNRFKSCLNRLQPYLIKSNSSAASDNRRKENAHHDFPFQFRTA